MAKVLSSDKKGILSMGNFPKPKAGAILETALYVADLARSIEFYQRVLGFNFASDPSERMCVLSVNADQVLLLFKKGGSGQPIVMPFGTIPAIGHVDGSLHVAFSILPSEFDAWLDQLQKSEVDVESVLSWPEGGQSIYFRDPDSHVIELKTSNWQGKELQ